jgi:hypothetical protein
MIVTNFGSFQWKNHHRPQATPQTTAVLYPMCYFQCFSQLLSVDILLKESWRLPLPVASSSQLSPGLSYSLHVLLSDSRNAHTCRFQTPDICPHVSLSDASILLENISLIHSELQGRNHEPMIIY